MSHTGISNRLEPEEEARNRSEHPPLNAAEPAANDPVNLDGDAAATIVPDLQTSHKVGTRADAQKEQGTRHPDTTTPAASKVNGAFGREPGDVADEAHESGVDAASGSGLRDDNDLTPG